jgi:hypothetical protein
MNRAIGGVDELLPAQAAMLHKTVSPGWHRYRCYQNNDIGTRRIAAPYIRVKDTKLTSLVADIHVR